MEILSLNGRWQFKQAATENKTWLAAEVPGCVHTDLMAVDAIPDPFYRDNELQVLWVGETDWQYRRTFTVTDSLLTQTYVPLRCEGLDTLATIWLNGTELGRADNMFRTWEFDAKPHLQVGDNEIVVQFNSAVGYGQQKLEERYIHAWNNGEKLLGANYVRKEQCQFGWDWGPMLVTCGIWRDISIIAYSEARLADVHVVQDHSTSGQVGLSVSVAIEGGRETAVSTQAICRILFNGEEVATKQIAISGKTGTASLPIDKPQLWWPNGMGSQPLYDVEVTLLGGDQPLDSWQKRIGLRTLELVREKDEWGESFKFACNGIHFFAKGANWIPADSFVTRLTDDNYAQLLQAAADTHMNMLRVWGGGIYEQSIFYDLCDELGICVWQDFMFGCATYPTFDDAFMANVEQEVVENVRRLRHHASLALWCGNNELEQGLVQKEWNQWAMSWEDYGKLFDELMPKLVAELDPETAYWPGSPHTPYDDRRDFNDPRWGDAHIWDVWHGMKPFEFYYTCFHRFNSEFGFQSFPEPQMVRTYTQPEDENITSYIMEHHQRHPSGNSTIMHYLLDWFRLPTSFESSLWLSQILQGMSVKHAVEHWRRTMPRGMGTLYWQLNDCWPVASWSSIDYNGRWKALHHMARHFYAPLLISAVPNLDDGTVAVHVTNDHLEEISGIVGWEVTTVDGERVAEGEETAVILPNQNTPITTLDLQALLAEHGKRNLLVWLTLRVDGAIVSTNLALFARPKHLSLPDPEILCAIEEVENGRYQVTLSSDKPALWVWLETQDGITVSDNFFHLRPGTSHVIRLTANERGLSIPDIINSLDVRSLVDTYQGN